MWKILCATNNIEVRSEIEKLGQNTSFFQVKCVSTSDDMFWSVVSERFDLYIVDADLRPGSAADLCRAIRACDDKGGIICLSSAETDRFATVESGADFFLKVPADIHLLRLKVEDLVHGIK